MHASLAEHAAAVAFLERPGVVPTGIVTGAGAPELVLTDLGSAPFTGPFFEDSVRACLGSFVGGVRRVRAPLSVLRAAIRFEDAIPLRGIVFHVSRCGSTVLTRLLQADVTTHVVAEADPIDAVATRLPLSSEERVTMLRAIVATYARQRTGSNARLALKLDAWHLPLFALFREAFPEVPFAVVVRDPLEVAVSHHRRRGSHVVPGMRPARLFDIGPDECPPHDLDRYTCLVLGALYRRAADVISEGGVLVRYESLPEGASDALSRFGVMLDGAARASTAWLATHHAKDPSAPFSREADENLTTAMAPLRDLVDALVRPAYDALSTCGGG